MNDSLELLTYLFLIQSEWNLYINTLLQCIRSCWHTIKPETPENKTTEHGTLAERRNTGRTYNRILTEQSEYHGIVEHEKSSGTT